MREAAAHIAQIAQANIRTETAVETIPSTRPAVASPFVTLAVACLDILESERAEYNTSYSAQRSYIGYVRNKGSYDTYDTANQRYDSHILSCHDQTS